jgi:hypothetical protein
MLKLLHFQLYSIVKSFWANKVPFFLDGGINIGPDNDSSILGPYSSVEHLILLKPYVKLSVSRRESLYGSGSVFKEVTLLLSALGLGKSS